MLNPLVFVDGLQNWESKHYYKQLSLNEEINSFLSKNDVMNTNEHEFFIGKSTSTVIF